jgi:hypothetical protein
MKKIIKRHLIIICSVLIGVVLLACVTIKILDVIITKKATHETIMYYLGERFDWHTPDINENYRLALEKYQNNRLDPEPIILFAMLREYPRNYYSLLVGIFDEDADLLGIIFKEESREPYSTVNTIEEKYPLFVYEPSPNMNKIYRIPVSIRTDNQRKDEKSWEDYLSKDLGYLREQADNYGIIDQWKETLPIVWISNPEAGDVTVWIQLYDKAGNKSNFVKLIEEVSRPS